MEEIQSHIEGSIPQESTFPPSHVADTDVVTVANMKNDTENESVEHKIEEQPHGATEKTAVEDGTAVLGEGASEEEQVEQPVEEATQPAGEEEQVEEHAVEEYHKTASRQVVSGNDGHGESPKADPEREVSDVQKRRMNGLGMPRSRKKTKAGRYTSDITYDELCQYFHLPGEQAAAKLGVGESPHGLYALCVWMFVCVQSKPHI